MKSKNRASFIIAGIAVMILMTAADLMIQGPADREVIRYLRIPRTVTAIFAGASLSLAGVQMQSILRNSLADPHIMGVSSGAALGAAIAVMCSGSNSVFSEGSLLSGLPIAAAAFIGAALSIALVIYVSRRLKSPTTLLIFGVMTGFIISAIVSILQFSSDAESLKIFYSWSAGSFSTTTWGQTAIMGIALVIGFLIAYKGRKGLDIILFGEEFAEMAGASPERIRLRSLLSSCLLTGAVTAFCGPLGFVGIAAPHIARAMTGSSSHSIVLPSALLTGCMISLSADIISQLSPVPLPVVSTMALVGIPIILYIMLKRPSL